MIIDRHGHYTNAPLNLARIGAEAMPADTSWRTMNWCAANC